jgi:RHS repeat-associated protein
MASGAPCAWSTLMAAPSHDNTQSGSPVSTRYFDQGAIISGTSYYYVKDSLGSVTQLISSTGTVASQYTYDPYGNQTTVSGTLVSDIGYAGYFYHAVSGLDFALHRAYDPIHTRWLNRDPIGEAGGINLYAYVNGNPLSYVDPLGEYCLSAVQIGAISGGAGGAVAGALAGAEAGLVAGGVGAIPGAIAGLAGGAALGVAGGIIVAETSGQAGYGGAVSSGKTNAGVIGGIATGVVSYGLNVGGGLNPVAANGIGGAVGGLYEAGLAGAALTSGAAIGAIGGLVSGLVQAALESGNDCGCGK